jgi:IS1 family transposase
LNLEPKNSSIRSRLQHQKETSSYASEFLVICLYSLLLC